MQRPENILKKAHQICPSMEVRRRIVSGVAAKEVIPSHGRMAWFLHATARRITKKAVGELCDEGAVRKGNPPGKREVRKGSRYAAQPAAALRRADPPWRWSPAR